MKKYFIILIIVLCISTAFYSYFASPHPPADFALTLIGEQRSLDPAICTSLQGARIIRALFEGLVRLDPKTLAPVPGIAKSWDISENGLQYTFHLRKAYWSDNTPVRAADFVYSWKRLLEPGALAEYDYMLFYLKNARQYRKGTIKDFDRVGVKAVNDSTLKVELENLTPYFLDIVAFESLMPVNKKCVETHGIKWTRPENIVTNGPYTMTHHQLNHKIRLEKSRSYWDTARAFFNIIDAYTCEGLNTAFNLYETGDAELIDDFPNIIAEEILKRKDKIIAPYLGTYFYRFNVKEKPFDDNRVRRAIEMAIDKAAIVKHITKGGEVAATGLVPPGMKGYPRLKGIPFHPDSARTLLAQAGFQGGRGFPKIELLYNTSENHKKIAEAVSHMLKKELNIHVEPLNIEWKVLLEKSFKKDYQIIRGSWIGDYTDPNTFIDMFVTGGGNNRTNWSNRSYDSLVQLAAATREPEKRMSVLAQAEKIIIEEGPLINIYFYVTKFLVKEHIKGFYPNIRGYFHLADLYRE